MRFMILPFLLLSACAMTQTAPSGGREIASKLGGPNSVDIPFNWEPSPYAPIQRAALRNCAYQTENSGAAMLPQWQIQLKTVQRNSERITDVDALASEVDGARTAAEVGALVACPHIERVIFNPGLVAFPLLTKMSPASRNCTYQVGDLTMSCASVILR